MNGNIETFSMNYDFNTKQIEYSTSIQTPEEFDKNKKSLNADMYKEKVKGQIFEFLKSSSFKIIEPKIDELFNLVQNLIQKDFDDNQEYFRRIEEILRIKHCKGGKK